MTPPKPESATERLARLLTMVPWLLHRQGIDIADAASQLGVSEQQIVDDLSLIFLCGTPGGLPGDLIEADWEGGHVFLGNADEIARPLRLGRDEALALIVALRAMAAVPGIGRHDAIDRALAKLESAAGEAAESVSQVSVAIDTDEVEQQVLPVAQQALADRRRIHLSYLVGARDEATERDVDPMRLLNVDGRWYLEGWCHRAEDVRLFRLDRVEQIAVLDTDGTPPSQARPRAVTSGLFQPGPQDHIVELQLAPAAAWVAENYPIEDADRAVDGSQVVRLRTADTTWVKRLVWRLGGQVVVLGPDSLREDVIGGARQAVQR